MCVVGLPGPEITLLWGLFYYFQSTGHFCHWAELNAEKKTAVSSINVLVDMVQAKQQKQKRTKLC